MFPIPPAQVPLASSQMRAILEIAEVHLVLHVDFQSQLACVQVSTPTVARRYVEKHDLGPHILYQENKGRMTSPTFNNFWIWICLLPVEV